jgi:hypothetical protein
MKLIEIKDKRNMVHYINPNQITQVFVQKDNTVTIIMSDGGEISSQLNYEEFMKLFS